MPQLTWLEYLVVNAVAKGREHFLFATKPLRESNAVPYRIEAARAAIEAKLGKKLINVTAKPKELASLCEGMEYLSNKAVDKYLGTVKPVLGQGRPRKAKRTMTNS